MTEALQLRQRIRKTAIFLLKISLSVAALWLVFRKVDTGQLQQVLQEANWWWWLPSVVLVAASKAVSALRLNGFFRRIGLALGERFNLQLYWLGMYYNLFLPGGIGGDAYKIYLLKKKGRASIRDLVLATLADRALGLLALFLLALGLAAWLRAGGYPSWGYIHAIPVLTGIAWLVMRGVKRDFASLFLPGLGWSFAVQLLQLVAVMALLQMTDTPTPWAGYLFLFLLSSVLTALPVSYGGAGARELAFYFGAAHLGLPEAPAVAVSLLFYLSSLAVSLSGMVFSFRKMDFPEMAG
ncbi:MAG: flippase-like domain-containing protein [Saprospiraceae bacterium]|nr:flippase-like domain-containing protein [Saprospiraceae bacterium]